MNNVIKILILSTLLLIILSSNIFATTTASEMFKQANDWINDGKTQAEVNRDTIDTTKLKSASTVIYNILLGVGTAVAIIVGAILGIQFMTAGVDQKVEVKKALPAYVISCIVLFGAMGIWKLLIVILGGIE